jgi:GntR family transcriptional regulator
MRLDNEKVMAERLGVSRPTVRRAVMYLVDRGLIMRKRGLGTQVIRPMIRRPVELSSLFDDLEAAGRQPRTDVLSFGVEEPPEVVASALDIALDSRVYAVERLRFTGDEPLSIMRNWIPSSVLDLDPDALRERGLYQVLRSSGVNLKIATQTIGGRGAKAAEARLLGEKPGAPLLTMTRTAYDETNRPVEYGSHIYRASLYTFYVTLTTG